MAFFVAKNEEAHEFIMSPETLMKAAPEYYGPRFDAIAELRKQDDGTLHRGQEFRRVASLVNVPMFMASKMIDPDWMKDKKRFYKWLARNPQYKSYDSRGGSRPSITVVDGKEV